VELAKDCWIDTRQILLLVLILISLISAPLISLRGRKHTAVALVCIAGTLATQALAHLSSDFRHSRFSLPLSAALAQESWPHRSLVVFSGIASSSSRPSRLAGLCSAG